MATETKNIMEKLEEIKSDLNYIKSRMEDIDLVVTDDDLESISEAEKDLARGKTRRL